MNLPEDIFFEHMEGYGITKVNRDDDAITREIIAIKQVADEIYFNWAFEVARVYLDIDSPSNISLKSMIFNGQKVPFFHAQQPLGNLSPSENPGKSKFPESNMLINFAGPAKTYPTYSAAFIPLGDYDKEIFKDKIVFIGASSVSLQDIYPTPFSASTFTPGVEVIANAVDTILSGEYLSIAPLLVTVTIIFVMAILSWVIIRIPRPTLAIGLMFAGIVMYFIARHIIFVKSNWIVTIVSPMLMLFLGVVVPTLEQAVTQEAEKRRVRVMFSRFISPEMVSQLLDTQEISSLNKRTELTILFSDIRGFTTISERLSPEEVVSLLNPYLEVMSSIIHKHGGTVDKYEGDAIVAFFGEPMPFPDHALRAARASLEMRLELKILTDGWKAEGRFTDIFEMGIGLNTGEVFVGLLGSEQRINYTVIGDTANLAARLQDQTKEFGFPILVSGETNEQIKSEIKTEFVASRILKGKSEPVQIYRCVLPDEGPRMII
jgi:adenylate cyclase